MWQQVVRIMPPAGVLMPKIELTIEIEIRNAGKWKMNEVFGGGNMVE
jgi:hypothetical protein